MEKKILSIGDIVQLNPNMRNFGGCLMTISEIKSFGYQGYCSIPGEERRLAYSRWEFKDCEYIGHCVWGIRLEEKEKEK